MCYGRGELCIYPDFGEESGRYFDIVLTEVVGQLGVEGVLTHEVVLCTLAECGLLQERFLKVENALTEGKHFIGGGKGYVDVEGFTSQSNKGGKQVAVTHGQGRDGTACPWA